MTLSRHVIHTDDAPKAVGPYSQAVRVGDLVFTAGQVAIEPTTGALAAGPIEDQTRQIFANLRAILEAAGSGLDQVVKVTVFMTDLGKFKAMNSAYFESFPADPPARSTVQVAALPLGAELEIECIATVR